MNFNELPWANARFRIGFVDIFTAIVCHQEDARSSARSTAAQHRKTLEIPKIHLSRLVDQVLTNEIQLELATEWWLIYNRCVSVNSISCDPTDIMKFISHEAVPAFVRAQWRLFCIDRNPEMSSNHFIEPFTAVHHELARKAYEVRQLSYTPEKSKDVSGGQRSINPLLKSRNLKSPGRNTALVDGGKEISCSKIINSTTFSTPHSKITRKSTRLQTSGLSKSRPASTIGSSGMFAGDSGHVTFSTNQIGGNSRKGASVDSQTIHRSQSEEDLGKALHQTTGLISTAAFQELIGPLPSARDSSPEAPLAIEWLCPQGKDGVGKVPQMVTSTSVTTARRNHFGSSPPTRELISEHPAIIERKIRRQSISSDLNPSKRRRKVEDPQSRRMSTGASLGKPSLPKRTLSSQCSPTSGAGTTATTTRVLFPDGPLQSSFPSNRSPKMPLVPPQDQAMTQTSRKETRQKSATIKSLETQMGTNAKDGTVLTTRAETILAIGSCGLVPEIHEGDDHCPLTPGTTLLSILTPKGDSTAKAKVAASLAITTNSELNTSTTVKKTTKSRGKKHKDFVAVGANESIAGVARTSRATSNPPEVNKIGLAGTSIRVVPCEKKRKYSFLEKLPPDPLKIQGKKRPRPTRFGPDSLHVSVEPQNIEVPVLAPHTISRSSAGVSSVLEPAINLSEHPASNDSANTKYFVDKSKSHTLDLLQTQEDVSVTMPYCTDLSRSTLSTAEPPIVNGSLDSIHYTARSAGIVTHLQNATYTLSSSCPSSPPSTGSPSSPHRRNNQSTLSSLSNEISTPPVTLCTQPLIYACPTSGPLLSHGRSIASEDNKTAEQYLEILSNTRESRIEWLSSKPNPINIPKLLPPPKARFPAWTRINKADQAADDGPPPSLPPVIRKLKKARAAREALAEVNTMALSMGAGSEPLYKRQVVFPKALRIPFEEDPRPLLDIYPQVWSSTRAELCETVEYFRSFQGGVYPDSQSVAIGYLLDGFPAPRDYCGENAKVIISHGGGGSTVYTNSSGVAVRGLAVDRINNKGSPEALFRAYRAKQAVALISGDRYSKFPFRLKSECRYFVLGWYAITHAWALPEAGVLPSGNMDIQSTGILVPVRATRYMFRFEWVPSQGTPWWDKPSEPLPTTSNAKHHTIALHSYASLLPTDSEPVPTSLAILKQWQNFDCQICHKTSPVILTEARCLQPTCASFFIGDTDRLEYTEKLLGCMDHGDEKYHLRSSLFPDRTGDTSITTDRNAWKGWHCITCGKLSVRQFWTRWHCSHCKTVKRTVIHQPIKPPVLKGLGERARYPMGLVSEKLKKRIDFFVLQYTLPRGVLIYHVKPVTCQHADNIFAAYQEHSVLELFERRELRQTPVSGARNRHFSFNSGQPYHYSSENTTVSLQESPGGVQMALRRVKEVVDDVLEKPSPAQDFNEVLSVAYMEDMAMNYHSDDEHGLKDIVASLSMGASCRMQFRAREKPDPTAIPWDAEELKKLSQVTLLTMQLRHGDIIIMTGDCQKLYQHRIQQVSAFRVAATCRFIEPVL